MHVVIWIIGGIVAGWLTGLVMRGRGYGLIGDLILGIVGGSVGGWLLAGWVPWKHQPGGSRILRWPS